MTAFQPAHWHHVDWEAIVLRYCAVANRKMLQAVFWQDNMTMTVSNDAITVDSTDLASCNLRIYSTLLVNMPPKLERSGWFPTDWSVWTFNCDPLAWNQECRHAILRLTCITWILIVSSSNEQSGQAKAFSWEKDNWYLTTRQQSSPAGFVYENSNGIQFWFQKRHSALACGYS